LIPACWPLVAAGIDIGSIASGLNQPIGPMRCLFLIQKHWSSPRKRAA
jgi:hypothetical protein